MSQDFVADICTELCASEIIDDQLTDSYKSCAATIKTIVDGSRRATKDTYKKPTEIITVEV